MSFSLISIEFLAAALQMPALTGRAIRFKSALTLNPTLSGLSTSIPGRFALRIELMTLQLPINDFKIASMQIPIFAIF